MSGFCFLEFEYMNTNCHLEQSCSYIKIHGNWKYSRGIKKTELSSGGLAPYSTDFSPSVSVLGTHLYQCTSWCCGERLHPASVNFFFEDSFSAFAHFMMSDLQVHLPISCSVFIHFWPKTLWPPCSTLSIHLISPWATFFLFPWMKKVLNGNCFSDIEEVKQKVTESLKGIKINEFKQFWEVEKTSP